jgi:hypothetical protein
MSHEGRVDPQSQRRPACRPRLTDENARWPKGVEDQKRGWPPSLSGVRPGPIPAPLPQGLA